MVADVIGIICENPASSVGKNCPADFADGRRCYWIICGNPRHLREKIIPLISQMSAEVSELSAKIRVICGKKIVPADFASGRRCYWNYFRKSASSAGKIISGSLF
jgi:hypothetical protein